MAIRDNIKHVGTIVPFSQLRKSKLVQNNRKNPSCLRTLSRSNFMRHVSFGFCSKKLFPRYFFMPPPTLRAWPAPLHLVADYFGINPPFVFCAQDLCCAEKSYFLTLTPYYRRAVRCHWMKKQKLALM